MRKRERSVCQQTWALLCKNFLKKWRKKRELFTEWFFTLLLLFILYLIPGSHHVNYFSQRPTIDLGRVDSFSDSYFIIAYAPLDKTTRQIMAKAASASFIKGEQIVGCPDEESMKELSSCHGGESISLQHREIVRVIFTTTHAYHLKFLLGRRIPIKKEHSDHTAHCYETYYNDECEVSKFWKKGFVALQAAINAAIIEITTNHLVMEQLMSTTGKIMKIDPFIGQGGSIIDICLSLCVSSFSLVIYYVSINVTKEKKKMKSLMTMMGLRESAFWLSWGLMYAGFIFIIALLMALILKSSQFVILSGFMVVFFLILLYGLSLIALAFLMSVLVKKAFITGLTVLLLNIFWGNLGLLALYRQLPTSLEWILSFLSPFAFMFGMSQLIHLDYDLNSNALSTPDFSNEIIATHFILAFDIFLYLALAIYFEKVLPNEYGHQYPPLFFLKSSFWSQEQKLGHVTLEDEIDLYCLSSDCFEPIPPEFHGKDAIRIRNVTKEYKRKRDKIEVLKDMVFDIYEGQITAILGNSGAGKSTLLNILSGLSIPTKGSVTIYNNKLSKMADLENISKLTGVCPQSNVQFDFLTVTENLRLFAKIKGIQPHEVDEEIQRVLLELEMTNIKNILAQNLSGGQKRKLTLGIAILGDPQIFLLDEPTAGLDPYSRHQVWNLLKKWKTDRVILFSTHFMDEADILADRKVFLSKGQLKCSGSSLFLKKKWGIGYLLSLQLNEMCMEGKITSLIKQHIPDAKLSAASKGKLVYTLPLERSKRFPEMFQNLESYPNLGIENYGVSMTTLNEVFLKLEGKSEERKQAGDPERLVNIEQILSSLNEMKKTIGGMALWRQQIWSLAKVRFLKLKHERRARVVLPLILAIGLCSLLLKYITVKVYQSSYVWELSPHSYFLAPGQPPRDPLTKLLIINKAGARIDDFIHSVERQNIALDIDKYGNKNGVDDLSYNGAIIVSGNKKDYSFSLVCNAKRLNCFPVLMDIVSNGLVGMVKQSVHIQTYRSTFWREQQDMQFEYELPWFEIWRMRLPWWFVFWPIRFVIYFISFVIQLMRLGMIWYILASIVAPTVALSSIHDFKIKVHSQLRISGLFPSAYWFGQALVDVPIYCLMFLFMYLMEYSLDHRETLKHVNKNIQIPCSIGYAISLIFLTYVIAFIFRKRRKNSGIWSLCFLAITGFSVFVIMLARDAFGYNTVYITFLIPLSALILPFFMYEPRPSLLSEEIMRTAEPFLIVLIPFLNFIIFVFILRCLEWKFGKKLMRKDPIFRISPRNNGVCQNPEDPEGEDEDVQMERERTASALSSINSDEKPVIIASCLRKEYRRRRKCCLFKKKIIATRNVSFCVRKGEVLGLLGHNGAGKSTSIKLITGDTQPTAGQVLLKGCSGTEPLGFLGYCPQENALWPNLTVREHLEVFASVKGLRKADATVAIARLVEVFKMQEELKLPVKNLSEGIKRKLCFALSILGNPSVVLLDEPSMGMDPEGQQQVWQAIRATLKNTERGVLLTTHNMAEAEAVCDRVAIMVSGRLSCIGSIQHLKSKFGKDYLLEMKVKTPEHGETLHAEILRLFPQAVQQERYSCLMAYKLPVEGVKPLAQAFFKLETVKQSFDLEEYSLSQSTLEEVFLELSKEQKLDEELHPSVKWKHLAQE